MFRDVLRLMLPIPMAVVSLLEFALIVPLAWAVKSLSAASAIAPTKVTELNALVGSPIVKLLWKSGSASTVSTSERPGERIVDRFGKVVVANLLLTLRKRENELPLTPSSSSDTVFATLGRA